MSPRRIGGEDGAGAGRSALAVVAVVVIAVVLVFVVRARPRAEPFDPRSSDPSGTRALVLLLQDAGAEVRVTETPPGPGDAGRLLVVDDRLDDVQRSAVVDFVDAGGTAVVADPSSSLHGGPGVEGGSTTIEAEGAFDGVPLTTFVATVDRGVCTIGALEHLRGLGVESGLSYPIAPTDPACFGDETHAFVVARTIGSGTVVGLGDNRVWTNRLLPRADNAGLATALLAPTDGSVVTLLIGTEQSAAVVPEVGGGDDTLVDLVHPSVWMALAQLALAFVVFAVARGIRPGRVVDEPLLTPIAGSEIVVATGNLMHRARHAERAAALLRYDAHRRVCAALRMPHDTPPSVLDRELSIRVGSAPGAVVDAMSGPAPHDEAGLMLVARRLSAVLDAAAALDHTAPPGTVRVPSPSREDR